MATKASIKLNELEDTVRATSDHICELLLTW